MTKLMVCVLAMGQTARAQEPYNLTASVRTLATLFTDLYGPRGLIVDSEATLPGEQPHTAHFISDFQFNFSQFSTAVVSQLVSVPLPSPASGFTYQFDPSLGVFQRTTQSFGPILAERAETIGAGRVSFGFTFQRFTFDTVENLDLGSVPAVFTHDNAILRGGREDVVTTTNVNRCQHQLRPPRSSPWASPIASMSRSRCQFVQHGSESRVGRDDPPAWNDEPVDPLLPPVERGCGRPAAVHRGRQRERPGDLTVRMKHTVSMGIEGGFAAGVDVRLPTGDAMNLLGSGATGVQPFGIWSATYQKVSPHINGSYTWNRSSVLAGNPASGVTADFPDQLGLHSGSGRQRELAPDACF